MAKVVCGNDVCAWPEFVAFATRLGVKTEKLASCKITISSPKDPVVIETTNLGVDNCVLKGHDAIPAASAVDQLTKQGAFVTAKEVPDE